MNRIRANVMIAGLAAAIVIATGCHKSVSAQNQSNDLGPDPAAANMAPGGDGSDASQQPAPAGQGTNEAITSAQTASPNDQPPADDQAVDQGYAAVDNSNDVDYDDATAQADQAPPPLPDYDQPPLPGDGYIWTPGYWAWAPAGYFWVPGAWTMPPYEGALWTPSWWGFHGGHYFFFRGYWGHYIGYYGGINYGFGYVGRGYEGGYWSGNRFQYNRTVNVIRITNVSVYAHPVQAPAGRFSYNGPGGARVRPAPAELNAMRQPRVAPMSTQMQAQREAQQNRAQFADQNHGRPAAVVVSRPVQADPHTQPLPPARTPQPQPAQQQPPRRGNQMQGPPSFSGLPQPRQTAPQAQPQQRPQPEPGLPQPRQTPPQVQPQRPAQNFSRPTPQPTPQQAPRTFQMQQRPEQQQQFTPRPAPEQAPQPAPRAVPEQRPAAPAPEAPRTAPAPRATPQARPAPAPASRPAPAEQPRGDDRPH